MASDAGDPRCGDLGSTCLGDLDCGGGYTCDTAQGACMPMGRPLCGGFAGAACPADSVYTECRYLVRADFGPCLTVEEARCACVPPARTYFVCRP